MRSRGRFLPADLCALAAYFFVSVEAMANRLEDLHLIGDGAYVRLLDAGFRPNEAKVQRELKSLPASNEQLPVRYRYLAAEAWEKEQITEDELAAYLHSDLVSARHQVRQLRSVPALSRAGEVGELDVALAQDIGS